METKFLCGDSIHKDILRKGTKMGLEIARDIYKDLLEDDKDGYFPDSIEEEIKKYEKR